MYGQIGSMIQQTRQKEGLWRYNNSTSYGMSGSPIILKVKEARFRIIGIHRGTGQNGLHPSNEAVNISQMIHNLTQVWKIPNIKVHYYPQNKSSQHISGKVSVTKDKKIKVAQKSTIKQEIYEDDFQSYEQAEPSKQFDLRELIKGPRKQQTNTKRMKSSKRPKTEARLDSDEEYINEEIISQKHIDLKTYINKGKQNLTKQQQPRSPIRKTRKDKLNEEEESKEEKLSRELDKQKKIFALKQHQSLPSIYPSTVKRQGKHQRKIYFNQ